MNNNIKLVIVYLVLSIGLGGISSKVGYDRYFNPLGLPNVDNLPRNYSLYNGMDNVYSKAEKYDALRPIHQFTKDFSYLSEDERFSENTFFLHLTINSLKLFFIPFFIILLIMNYAKIKLLSTVGIPNYMKKLNPKQKNILAIIVLLVGFVLSMAISSSIDIREKAFNFQNTWFVWISFLLVIGYLEYKIFES